MPNLSLVGPLISLWQPNLLPVGVAIKLHPLPHPQEVILQPKANLWTDQAEIWCVVSKYTGEHY